MGLRDVPTPRSALDLGAVARDAEWRIKQGSATYRKSTIAQVFARFGSPASVPKPVLSPDDVKKLPLEPRSAFVLSHVDGQSSVETILDLCGMPSDEVLEALVDLLSYGAIDIGE
jgi:hypothetical protein